MLKNKITVTVGIPTYFAEKNILSLLRSIVSQKGTNYQLKEILVYSDGNTDKTVSEAKKLRSKKIIIFDVKERNGMAFGLKFMLSKSKGDLFLLLNDDILIRDKNMISKMVAAYLRDEKVGLVSGNPQPLKSSNFIVNAQISTFRAFERTRYLMNNGQNKFTCDGKILMMSKGMWSAIKFPKDNGAIGNVDAFLYMANKKLGFKYVHARGAIVYFDFPNTVREFIKWSSRNNANARLLEKQFGSLVKKEFVLPRSQHMISMLLELIKNPFGAIFLYMIGLYAKRKSKQISKNFSPTWEVITSTKRKL